MNLVCGCGILSLDHPAVITRRWGVQIIHRPDSCYTLAGDDIRYWPRCRPVAA